MTRYLSPVIRITNSVFQSNTYICRTSTPGTCLIIDPGHDREAIETALDEAELIPLAVFCTHGHFDHLGSAEYFRRRYSIAVHLHTADAKVARSSNFLMMALKLRSRISLPEEQVAIHDGMSLSIGGDRIGILHVPGHTPGSTVVLVNGYAFTGDTVYRKNAHMGSLPETDPAQLVASVRRLWDLLPDETLVYPGHGSSARFGQIKRLNAPLRRMVGLAESVTL